MKPSIITILTLLLLLFLSPFAFAGDKVKSLCNVRYPSDAGIEWQCVLLKWSDTPGALFGDAWPDVLRFNRMDRRHFHGGISIKVPQRLEEIRDFTPLPKRLPEAAEKEKFILVSQSEMFLGAYEHGELVFSFPVAVGIKGHRVPNGTFNIDAADRTHQSNLYTVEEIGRPYPMHYALRFFVDKSEEGWPAHWIHGRDVPGYPASHGCIGLYDEEMQFEYYDSYDRKVNKPFYHELKKPFLEAAKTLYLWVRDEKEDPSGFHMIANGPQVEIVGEPPL